MSPNPPPDASPLLVFSPSLPSALPSALLASDGSSRADLLLSHEYGKREALSDLLAALAPLSPSVRVLDITLSNFHTAVDLALSHSATPAAVVQLCDGTETDGYPGASVVRLLELYNVPFTGSGSEFYEISTSKPVLKRFLLASAVPTSPFLEVGPETTEDEVRELVEREVGAWPLIVKPAVSYASLAISDASVVHTPAETIKQCARVREAQSGGVFVEGFLKGREFTALCTGSEKYGVKVYPVVERVFSRNLEVLKRFLAFDRYWEGYGMDENKNEVKVVKEGEKKDECYVYALAPEEWQEKLQERARAAYVACRGSGYGRVDMRTKSDDDPEAYVLEVNANCGLSFNKETSTLGQILYFSKTSPVDLMKSLLDFAVWRQKSQVTN